MAGGRTTNLVPRLTFVFGDKWRQRKKSLETRLKNAEAIGNRRGEGPGDDIEK